MKLTIILSTFLLFINFNFSQNYEIEKVTISELEEKAHVIDTSAVAAFLFKKTRTYFNYSQKNGFESVTEFTIKIKIYKKEGISWSDFEIPYYVGYKNLDDEKVNILKAFTYNLENGKILKQKVTNEGKLKNKINDSWQTEIITFPNVKTGSIIELKYELKTQNLSELPEFRFQYKIPVNYAQYQTEIPEIYIYKPIKSGFIPITMSEKLENGSISYLNQYQRITLNFKQIRTLYEVADVPALIDEDYVNNADDYCGKIDHELQVIRYPNEEPKQISTTWENVTKSIYNDEEFGGELKKSKYYLNDLKRIIDTVTTDESKMKIVFEFVKNKMNWNGKYGYYTKKGVENAYLENSGNIAEINIMLTSMLKMSGLEANPVLLSSIGNGIALFPNKSKLNYVICCVELNDKKILLDATEKFTSINCLPLRDLNYKGRLIKYDGDSIEIDLIPHQISLESINVLANISADGEITGKIRDQYFEYNSLKFRQNNLGISKESYIEKLEKKLDNIEISNYTISNENQTSEPIIEIYDFKSNSFIETIGNKLYVAPLLFLTTENNPFKKEKREYPIDFLYPNKTKFNCVFEIPNGYEIETLPKSVSLTTAEKNINFNLSSYLKDNKITIIMNFEINCASLGSEYYDSLKEFFKVIIEKQSEKIVLKKV